MICDTATGRQQTALRGPRGHGFDDVDYLPDGKTLATLVTDKTVRLWDVATAQQCASLELATVSAHLAVSADGKTLAVGGFQSDPMFGVIDLIDIAGTTLQHRPSPR